MFPIFAGNSASTGYNLTRSLRFRSSATAWLNRTLSAGNQKTWTWSGWVKRGTLSTAQAIFDTGVLSSSDSTFGRFGFDPSDAFNFTAYSISWRTTTQVFRDPSSWYHIVLAFDTTQATAANRVKVYVNGAQVTAFSSSTDPALNTNYAINQAAAHYFGYPAYAYSYFDGYLAEVNFIDGQALTPSSFGSYNALTGVWQPARYTGTYGTNGFYLPFTDNSALTTSSNVGLGKDFSGNGNYWTTNNISLTAGVTYDSMTDVPTLTSASASNFAVLNPVNSALTLTAGNQNWAGISSGAKNAFGTIAVTGGKWYFETTLSNTSSSGNWGIGLTNNLNTSTTTQIWTSINGWMLLTGSGGLNLTKYHNSTSSIIYSAANSIGAVIGVAFDVTNGGIWFSRNGVWLEGDPAAGTGASYTDLSGTVQPVAYGYDSNDQGAFNAGQRPFSYTPPTGFVALNTYNLPTSTIVKGNTVMDATLYTGTGANQSIVNAAGFKPDFVWGKLRNGADQNFLVNSVAGATNYLVSNSTQSEVADATTIASLNSNGFTVGTNTNLNRSGGYNFVGWQWQAGQGSTSSNTNGTITSTVSVNASAGFSIVTYTGNGIDGATVGHGLGVAPQMIITKKRDAVGTDYGWSTYHVSNGNANIWLNLTNAKNPGNWNTAPTSSVFTPAILLYNNVLASTYVNYCWTPISGYSAFGSYTGNGSTDGAFVYTGFRPKFVLIKRTDSAGYYWRIWDSSRATYNAGLPILYPNVSDAEDSVSDVYDLLSNGFKLRTTTTGSNASGGTYIYAAFAENPFKNSLAR
jgi:hypothetical protein